MTNEQAATTTTNNEQQLKALNIIAQAVVEAVRASGPVGAPGGHIYAALMTVGINLEQFEAIASACVRAGLIRKVGQSYFPAR